MKGGVYRMLTLLITSYLFRLLLFFARFAANSKAFSASTIINLPTCLYAPSINPLCFMRLAVVFEHLNSSAIPARP